MRLFLQCRNIQVRYHDALHAGVYHTAKGVQFQRFQLLYGFVDGRQVFVRISLRITMAGKVLGTGHYTIVLQAAHIGYTQFRHHFLSSPKERALIIGFFGLLFTSTTGAKSICTPRRLHCAATATPSL